MAAVLARSRIEDVRIVTEVVVEGEKEGARAKNFLLSSRKHRALSTPSFSDRNLHL
jgi:hypothetical protein